MAIVKLNNYIPDKDVENLIDNVDKNFISDDKTTISVNYGTTPATVSVLIGSIIEANGDRYMIQTANESFQMSNATHNYITFNGTSFSSAATIGTFDATKHGYYATTNRTLKYYIDQSNETELLLRDVLHSNRIQTIKSFDRIKAYMSTSTISTVGIIPIDTIVVDELSRFDTVNYKYTAIESGYYHINLKLMPYTEIQASGGWTCEIRKNGSSIARVADQSSLIQVPPPGVYDDWQRSTEILDYLKTGDEITFYLSVRTPVLEILGGSEDETYITIQRVL